MTTVASSDLEKRLGAYLVRVREGEEVVVTDEGKPVAKLVPVTSNSGLITDMATLARSGRIRPPVETPTAQWAEEFLGRTRVQDPGGHVLKSLIEERESGW
jgi:prevent-host-death family protein